MMQLIEAVLKRKDAIFTEGKKLSALDINRGYEYVEMSKIARDHGAYEIGFDRKGDLYVQLRFEHDPTEQALSQTYDNIQHLGGRLTRRHGRDLETGYWTPPQFANYWGCRIVVNVPVTRREIVRRKVLFVPLGRKTVEKPDEVKISSLYGKLAFEEGYAASINDINPEDFQYPTVRRALNILGDLFSPVKSDEL